MRSQFFSCFRASTELFVARQLTHLQLFRFFGWEICDRRNGEKFSSLASQSVLHQQDCCLMSDWGGSMIHRLFPNLKSIRPITERQSVLWLWSAWWIYCLGRIGELSGLPQSHCRLQSCSCTRDSGQASSSVDRPGGYWLMSESVRQAVGQPHCVCWASMCLVSQSPVSLCSVSTHHRHCDPPFILLFKRAKTLTCQPTCRVVLIPFGSDTNIDTWLPKSAKYWSETITLKKVTWNLAIAIIDLSLGKEE